MSDVPPAAAPSHTPVRRDPFRLLAAALCGLQAVVLLGFCVFYLWELVQGAGADPTRVVMSIVLIAVFAVLLGVLGRAWLRGANWPNTPTIVWNVLLLPVAWSLFQAGRAVLALALGVVGILGIVAAVRADTSDRDGFGRGVDTAEPGA
ncbi:hypothetical protein ACFUC1_14275 [Pedococcus sp. NPDC057267]|uniref:hypothetical protein n=1 Tax=Pedococcus sp. NPDC057267 TaxID=3346077 RepID=UPI0036446F26